MVENSASSGASPASSQRESRPTCTIRHVGRGGLDYRVVRSGVGDASERAHGLRDTVECDATLGGWKRPIRDASLLPVLSASRADVDLANPLVATRSGDGGVRRSTCGASSMATIAECLVATTG